MSGTKKIRLTKRFPIILGIMLVLLVAGMASVINACSHKEGVPFQPPVSFGDTIQRYVGQRVPLDPEKIPLAFRILNPGYSTDNPKMLKIDAEGKIFAERPGQGNLYAGTGMLRLKVAKVQVFPKKIIYLTFDDGPSRNITPQILEILRKNGIHATFFLVGQYVNYYPDLVKAIDRDGNMIGVHSDTHNYHSIYKSQKSLIRDVNRLDEKLEKIVHKKNRVYRFPGGSFEPRRRFGEKQKDNLVSKLNHLGYRCFDWNASLGDADGRGRSAESMFRSAKRTIGHQDRVVLLAHDMGLRKNTPKAIEKIIHYYKKKGYQFDTLNHYQGQYLFP